MSIKFAQNFDNHFIELKECLHSLVVRYAQFPELKNLLKIVLFILFTKLPAKISIPLSEGWTSSSHKKLPPISSFEYS